MSVERLERDWLLPLEDGDYDQFAWVEEDER